MPVQNLAIAALLAEIADRLEIQGGNPFRIRAYRNAAGTVQELQRDVKQLTERGETLAGTPGVGADLAGKIGELATRGSCDVLERLRREMPSAITELLKVPGLGPKRVKGREEARTLREMLSFTKKKEADPLMDYLVSFRDRMEHARLLLTDARLTAFFFVTLPEALPIAVVTRFIQWFKDFGIPVGGVLVNMVIDPASVGPSAAEFVRNRVAMQQEHMQTIWREFDDGIRAIVPLFDAEVRGVPMLERLCDAIFAADGARPASAGETGRPREVAAHA